MSHSLELVFKETKNPKKEKKEREGGEGGGKTSCSSFTYIPWQWVHPMRVTVSKTLQAVCYQS